MPWFDLIWDDGPHGNVAHIAEHGITTDEVREVLKDHATERDTSRSSGQPLAMGWTRRGRFLVVVDEQIDAHTVYPLTAYEPDAE